MKRNLKKIGILCGVLFLLVSCQKQDTSLKETNEINISESTLDELTTESNTTESNIEESVEETTEEGFQGRIISSMYEDYYMYWDDICVLIITYTSHFEGTPEFGLIGYNGTENPVLFFGNTKKNGYGEYDMYCFKDNRVYKSDETIKGKLHYNKKTKEFASLGEDGICNIYMYYSNHIVWLREEPQLPNGFSPMTLTSSGCQPPPMIENIRNFIIY